MSTTRYSFGGEVSRAPGSDPSTESPVDTLSSPSTVILTVTLSYSSVVIHTVTLNYPTVISLECTCQPSVLYPCSSFIFCGLGPSPRDKENITKRWRHMSVSNCDNSDVSSL